MTPETKARLQIDQKLLQAGWLVQDMKNANLSAGMGIAIREYPTNTGPADYVLFINRKPVGVIEAKRDEAAENITVVESQTKRYGTSGLKHLADGISLPFGFESTGQITRFTDSRDPAPRSRELFHFYRPAHLAALLRDADTLRGRLQRMPSLPTENLRDCQIAAVNGLEQSLAQQRPRALIHMATGAGKTFTAITAVYRLLKFAKAKRVLFLVDTRNLGKQAHQEFMAYQPPDDGRKFTELYNVQRLSSATLDPHAQVCISTIQRMYSVLSGQPIDESAEDISLNEVEHSEQLSSRVVSYNPDIPIESFDFIIIDECHRSIYNRWKQVLDYFDAFLIGLTATPDKRTFGFFNENIVAQYSYEQSVVDGVNVGYDVYEIQTEITSKGQVIAAKAWVDHRDRQTRAKRWAQTEDVLLYDKKQLDRSVVNPSQIRHVISAMKTAVEHEIFPSRKETPKTLIFAKTDSHADDIIQTVREVYGQGNAFCQKVTYNAANPDEVLSNFRNEYHPRIAVTVDMIATGTDVKPLEVLLFMRDVRSRGYYEQMKGRGVRSLGAEGLKKVSASASSAKTRFVMIDAVGVEKSLKTESRSLEKNPTVPLKGLLQGVALGSRDEATILSLANRLIRLNKQLDDKVKTQIQTVAGGVSIGEIAKRLVAAVDPDQVQSHALALAAARGITRDEQTLLESERLAAQADLVNQACEVFDAPELREVLERARVEHEQVIDTVNLDQVIFAGFSEQAADKAQAVIASFEAYLAEHRDEIAALGFFYDQPYQRRALTLGMIESLHATLSRPPLLLTTERLWSAYARVKGSQVKGVDVQRQLTDVVALLRFALGLDAELKPFVEQVNQRFQDWVFRHNAQRSSAFSEEQMLWLRMMRDHIAASCSLAAEDFEYGSFASQGAVHKAVQLFGETLRPLMDELNEELVA